MKLSYFVDMLFIFPLKGNNVERTTSKKQPDVGKQNKDDKARSSSSGVSPGKSLSGSSSVSSKKIAKKSTSTPEKGTTKADFNDTAKNCAIKSSSAHKKDVVDVSNTTVKEETSSNTPTGKELKSSTVIEASAEESKSSLTLENVKASSTPCNGAAQSVSSTQEETFMSSNATEKVREKSNSAPEMETVKTNNNIFHKGKQELTSSTVKETCKSSKRIEHQKEKTSILSQKENKTLALTNLYEETSLSKKSAVAGTEQTNIQAEKENTHSSPESVIGNDLSIKKTDKGSLTTSNVPNKLLKTSSTAIDKTPTKACSAAVKETSIINDTTEKVTEMSTILLKEGVENSSPAPEVTKPCPFSVKDTASASSSANTQCSALGKATENTKSCSAPIQEGTQSSDRCNLPKLLEIDLATEFTSNKLDNSEKTSDIDHPRNGIKPGVTTRRISRVGTGVEKLKLPCCNPGPVKSIYDKRKKELKSAGTRSRDRFAAFKNDTFSKVSDNKVVTRSVQDIVDRHADTSSAPDNSRKEGIVTEARKDSRGSRAVVDTDRHVTQVNSASNGPLTKSGNVESTKLVNEAARLSKLPSKGTPRANDSSSEPPVISPSQIKGTGFSPKGNMPTQYTKTATFPIKSAFRERPKRTLQDKPNNVTQGNRLTSVPISSKANSTDAKSKSKETAVSVEAPVSIATPVVSSTAPTASFTLTATATTITTLPTTTTAATTIVTDTTPTTPKCIESPKKRVKTEADHSTLAKEASLITTATAVSSTAAALIVKAAVTTVTAKLTIAATNFTEPFSKSVKVSASGYREPMATRSLRKSLTAECKPESFPTQSTANKPASDETKNTGKDKENDAESNSTQPKPPNSGMNKPPVRHCTTGANFRRPTSSVKSSKGASMGSVSNSSQLKIVSSLSEKSSVASSSQPRSALQSANPDTQTSKRPVHNGTTGANFRRKGGPVFNPNQPKTLQKDSNATEKNTVNNCNLLKSTSQSLACPQNSESGKRVVRHRTSGANFKRQGGPVSGLSQKTTLQKDSNATEKNTVKNYNLLKSTPQRLSSPQNSEMSKPPVRHRTAGADFRPKGGPVSSSSQVKSLPKGSNATEKNTATTFNVSESSSPNLAPQNCETSKSTVRHCTTGPNFRQLTDSMKNDSQGTGTPVSDSKASEKRSVPEFSCATNNAPIETSNEIAGTASSDDSGTNSGAVVSQSSGTKSRSDKLAMTNDENFKSQNDDAVKEGGEILASFSKESLQSEKLSSERLANLSEETKASNGSLQDSSSTLKNLSHANSDIKVDEAESNLLSSETEIVRQTEYEMRPGGRCSSPEFTANIVGINSAGSAGKISVSDPHSSVRDGSNERDTDVSTNEAMVVQSSSLIHGAVALSPAPGSNPIKRKRCEKETSARNLNISRELSNEKSDNETLMGSGSKTLKVLLKTQSNEKDTAASSSKYSKVLPVMKSNESETCFHSGKTWSELLQNSYDLTGGPPEAPGAYSTIAESLTSAGSHATFGLGGAWEKRGKTRKKYPVNDGKLRGIGLDNLRKETDCKNSKYFWSSPDFWADLQKDHTASHSKARRSRENSSCGSSNTVLSPALDASGSEQNVTVSSIAEKEKVSFGFNTSEISPPDAQNSNESTKKRKRTVLGVESSPQTFINISHAETKIQRLHDYEFPGKQNAIEPHIEEHNAGGSSNYQPLGFVHESLAKSVGHCGENIEVPTECGFGCQIPGDRRYDFLFHCIFASS